MYATDAGLEEWIAERDLPDSLTFTDGGEGYVTRDVLNRYDGEIRYLDDQLGIFFQQLRSRRLLGRSVVAVVGDHGEGLNQHQWNRHGRVHEEQIHVPFLLHLPGGRGPHPARVDALVSTADVMPTVLPFVHGQLARRFAAQATGRDVFAPDYHERPLLALRMGKTGADDSDARSALVTPEWKLIHGRESGNQLFDRQSDPHELVDLAPERPDVVRALLEALAAEQERQARRAAGLGGAGEARAVDPELLRELEAIGYWGDSE